MILLEEFILRAMMAGVGVAAVGGPLGCFIVWRRMAYFGDTMAHGALLGVALGLVTAVPVMAAIVAVGAVLAFWLTALARQGRFGSDTLLGIFSHSALSVGLVTLAMMENVRVDLLGYLFGDILAVSWTDVIWIYAGGLLILGGLLVLWRPLLATTVHAELAQAEGVPVTRVQFGFMLLIALVIAIAMKIVGILLITSLLIIPAAAARTLARLPETMAVLAALFGVAAVIGGMAASAFVNTPTGPSIVVAAFVLFIASFGVMTLRGRNAPT